MNKQRLLHKINELKERWDLLSTKLSKLERAKILETQVDEKYRLEKKIEETEAERQQVEKRLKKLEAQIVPLEENSPDAEQNELFGLLLFQGYVKAGDGKVFDEYSPCYIEVPKNSGKE